MAAFKARVSVFLFLAVLFSVSAEDGLQVGSRAPDFRLPLAGASGVSGLSDFADKKIIIVHFWKSK